MRINIIYTDVAVCMQDRCIQWERATVFFVGNKQFLLQIKLCRDMYRTYMTRNLNGCGTCASGRACACVCDVLWKGVVVDAYERWRKNLIIKRI